MSDNLKKLTGKNKAEYEFAARQLVESCDVELFKELVEKDDFLFDFVKQNVAERLDNAINETNYKNLLEFLKYYSPYYDDVIISNLAKYSDEDLTDTMLEKFENGTDSEKAYCAKYFGVIKDSLAYDMLRKGAYSSDEYLARNCAQTLALWQDSESYNDAISKLSSDDDFERLSAVKFLTAYGNKDAVFNILNSMKNSTMSENISCELLYLINIFELMDKYPDDSLLVINNVINGLGEILPLCVVFDFELYDVFEDLLHSCISGKCAITLLNALDKFETLTENDEYLFDEDKDTKNEVNDIKKLLKKIDKIRLGKLVNEELREDSPFVYFALDCAADEIQIRELLRSNNQTLVLKTAETLKRLGCFDETARQVALLKVTDINIKSIIRAL